MTSEPYTVTEDATLEEIVHLMEQHHVKRLPVMRADLLVGIVTRSNLLQAVAELAREVPDPTADDDHIRNHIIASIEKADWGPLELGVMCATAMCISAASLPTSGFARRRWWLLKTFRASRRCTTTCAGSSRCRVPT